MKKIFVVGSQKHYANFIDDKILVDNLEDADIIIFTGGEDVDPSLYQCERYPNTFSNIQRDLEEKAIFDNIKPNQFVIGICRGSQFLCVMNGGKLIQDVNNHAIKHTHTIVELNTHRDYEITSTHHQMQYPFDIPKEQWTCLFITSRYQHADYYAGDKITNVPYEPEVVLYHRNNKPKCLAIQGHPEYMQHESPIIIRLNEIINTLVKNEN